MLQIAVQSEIGRLETVVIHSPGIEVEKMTPSNAQRALYSDILNLAVANQEYNQFRSILSSYCKTLEVRDLLTETMDVPEGRKALIENISKKESDPFLLHEMAGLSSSELAKKLVEGIELKRDNLTRFLGEERYSLKPLHNFFFTRDAAMTIGNKILIGEMASPVRAREAMIMDAIFRFHPSFRNSQTESIVLNPLANMRTCSIEGGDVLVARDDILLVGTGARTSTQGVDYLIESMKQEKGEKHLIVQELPLTPESFIHLDMVFTFLDKDTCMIYEPLLNKHSHLRTIHIHISQGNVREIKQVSGLLPMLARLGMKLHPIACGGNDEWDQEREQWHSGTNFLALAPGVVIGYERNVHTIESLRKNGFRIVKALEITENKLSFPTQKTVITIAGAELARGGGGARCMSMPLQRKNVDW